MPVEIKREVSQSPNKRKKKDDQISIQLDVETLTSMCRFVISDSIYIKRYDLTQIRKFLEVVDTNKLARTSIEITDRLNFIRYALEAKLDVRLNGKESVISYINQKFTKDIDIDLSVPIGREDIEWINEFTAETLKYVFIYQDIDMLRNICNEFTQTSIGHRGDIVNKFEDAVDLIKNQFRNVRSQDSMETKFSLQGENFENMITDTYNKLKSPSRRLYTGMQGFNQLTNGFESGRVYMLFGITGGGKSITLLNLAFQIKKYNKGYVPKDPTKRPCVVMLTMENSVTETIDRLFDLVCNNNIPMSHYDSAQQVLDKLKETGELVVDDGNPIDFVVKYKPNHSVSTDYMYTLFDELEDEGYEPICFIQDHVKRIKAVDNDKDLRLELGNIVNEFKVFATLKDIPVISNSHLNREAARTIDNGANKSKADITRMLGKENVGESLVMLDNLDMGIIINKDWDREGNLYMVFSTIKSRYRTERDYIAQPFVAGSTIRLVEDVGSPVPMFRESLRSSGNLVGMYGNMVNTNSSMYKNNVLETDNMFTSDDTNLFGSGTSYNSGDRYIPQLDQDNIPLKSDIPEYNKEEKRESIDPFIYDEPNTTEALLKDLEELK